MKEDTRHPNQRLRILYTYKIMLEQTDEEHPLTATGILQRLEDYGISAGRKTLYDDIEALKMFGLDIISSGRNSGYYVCNRDFELPELKLLADAVSSSKFLTEKKSKELLGKITKLASVHEARQLRRTVYTADRTKSMNERIYLNVDVIQRAIDEKRQISFKYFSYDVHKNKVYRDSLRICSPYAMAWDNERYYLVSYCERHPDSFTHFRVDRMEDVKILVERAKRLPSSFNISDYLNSSFSMFSGKSERVTIRFKNSLVTAVIDRFGKDMPIVIDGDEHFIAHVNANTENPVPFFSWLAKFGVGAEILEPLDLRNEFIEFLGGLSNVYNIIK